MLFTIPQNSALACDLVNDETVKWNRRLPHPSANCRFLLIEISFWACAMYWLLVSIRP